MRLKTKDELFEAWWKLNGQHLESKLGFQATKREIASYAFAAGYIVGKCRAGQKTASPEPRGTGKEEGG